MVAIFTVRPLISETSGDRIVR